MSNVWDTLNVSLCQSEWTWLILVFDWWLLWCCCLGHCVRVYPKLLLEARGQVEETRKMKMLKFVSLDPIFRYARNQWTFIHCDLVLSLSLCIFSWEGGRGGWGGTINSSFQDKQTSTSLLISCCSYWWNTLTNCGDFSQWERSITWAYRTASPLSFFLLCFCSMLGLPCVVCVSESLLPPRGRGASASKQAWVAPRLLLGTVSYQPTWGRHWPPGALPGALADWIMAYGKTALLTYLRTFVNLNSECGIPNSYTVSSMIKLQLASRSEVLQAILAKAWPCCHPLHCLAPRLSKDWLCSLKCRWGLGVGVGVQDRLSSLLESLVLD